MDNLNNFKNGELDVRNIVIFHTITLDLEI